MATPAIEVSGLTRRLGEREVLKDVSFSLAPGRTLVIFGPNGAGKTTLLRVLATLLRPHAGTATVLGCELPSEGWQLRSRIGLLGHAPLLYSDLSLDENLRYYAGLYGVKRARIDELVAATGLTQRAADPVHTYSRGMLQRAAACRALLHDPELLLLDEPRANLDPAASEALGPLLAGRTRVITSHDPAGGLAEADEVLGLRGGRVHITGPADQIDVAAIGELYA
ncbi:MAG TPA: ABC transporter ATP-binding protein [Baekduia sp.]|nr:ABC transporter ATP-binding protein [Baekduia sp.]